MASTFDSTPHIPRSDFRKDQTAGLPLCFGLMLYKHVLHLFGHVDDAVHGVLGIHNRDCSVREVDVLPAQIEHFPRPKARIQGNKRHLPQAEARV